MSARSEIVEAVVVYNLKLWLAGFAAALFIPLSWAAAALDFVTGRDLDTGLLGAVLSLSARLEARVDVHGPLTDIRLTETQDAVV